jgi:dTDP-4-dehydrorhamnose reductase
LRVLITGISGMIGSNIAAVAAERDWVVTGTWHSCPVAIAGVETLHLDVTDADAWHDLTDRAVPDVIIHNAASVELLRLESEPDLAQGNVIGTVNAVTAAGESNARLALVSSDWIFDGELPPGERYFEDDDPDPVNAYGRSKRDSELALRSAEIDWLITRPANVYGVNVSTPENEADPLDHVLRRSSLAVRWLMRLARGEQLRGPATIYQSPTSAWSYSNQLCDLIDAGERGVFHTAGGEQMHRLDYMRSLAEDFGFDREQVIEEQLDEALADMLENPAASRLAVPSNTALSVAKVAERTDPQANVRQGHSIMRRQLTSRGLNPNTTGP